MAATSEKRLWWDDAGAARLGTGVRWTDVEFDPVGWSPGTLPAGYGFAGLGTDLTSTMKGKAPSLYLRRVFQVTPDQATSTNALILSIQYNDGFVAYLNGREIARANCGATNHFMFCGQPAYNVSTTAGVVEFTVGPAAAWLSQTSNVLALQAHNAEQPSTTSAPEQIGSHTPTPEFRICAGLRLAADTNSIISTNVLSFSQGGMWRYFVGRVEPSGGLIDMGLVNRSYNPPVGEEDDYDQPAAFSDWVELANYGSEPVDLGGWSLSDSRDVPGMWHFPTNTTLQPGKFLLVLCDQRNDANAPAGPATLLHTSFKLDGNGEYLALYDASGRYVDGFPDGFPPQVHYCSYGRNPDNPAVFGYLASASPGKTNTGAFYSGRVSAPMFVNALGEALPGGIYSTQGMALYLGSASPGSTVKYTTNGTTPTETSGFVFSEPIVLAQSSDKTGIVVRARAFRGGFLPSETITHSYLLRQPGLLANSPALLMSGEPGTTFYAPDGLLAIVGGQFLSVSGGTIWQATGPQTYDNVLGAGSAFEREASLEFYPPLGYYPSNQAPFRAQVGMRVSASPWSRPRLKLSSVNASPWPPGDVTQKPSFNIYFSGDYGAGGLKYSLFTNYPVSDFQHLRLRAGKNDLQNPFVTDELVRRLWIDMGHAGARGLFCSGYVNGVYKGVFNLCERIREQFFQAHYDSNFKWDICYSGSWVDGDATVYNQMCTALDRDLAVLSNWQAAARFLDLENVADYYLLNIYCSMWDWPGNNYALARERSSGPQSGFQCAVWDAEGAFNATGYGKAVSYNSITSDLLVPSSNWSYYAPLPRIFRRIVSCPEGRLFFADRINHLFFNNGILDDRDPDGAGPLKSWFRRRQDEMVAEAGRLVQYNSGQALIVTPFNSWTSPTVGRRTWLLGTNTSHKIFRDAGLWPVTEPPVFSQFGGTVSPGFPLTMTSYVAVTGQTATVYYTLDRSDPRLPGGALSQTAIAYSVPVLLNSVVTVKARARNDTTGEWSALTAATFAPAAVPASSDNLVVAELMYHPPGPTSAEVSSGFLNAEDFEFIRLLNIGATPVVLSGVRFTLGITFDFSGGDVQYLSPGAGVLVVKRKAAFQIRYGHQYDSLIAGEYDGNLANGGERVQLLGTNSAVIRDFAYLDSAPWPAAADGMGPSLLLREPYANPDPANAGNWSASVVPGGMPGGVAPSQSYSVWRSLFWDRVGAADSLVSGASADPDGDGLNNLVEYAFGLDPHIVSTAPTLSWSVEAVDGEPHLCLSLRVASGATNARLLWETSPDLVNWTDDTAAFQILGLEPALDGTGTVRYRELNPIATAGQRFIRPRVTLGN